MRALGMIEEATEVYVHMYRARVSHTVKKRCDSAVICNVAQVPRFNTTVISMLLEIMLWLGVV